MPSSKKIPSSNTGRAISEPTSHWFSNSWRYALNAPLVSQIPVSPPNRSTAGYAHDAPGWSSRVRCRWPSV